MAGDFAGQVAVVTGAARGIGRAIAETLSARGAAVAVIDRNAGGAEAVANALKAGGREALAIGGDVARGSEWARFSAEILAWKDRVDILCPNAAIFDGAPVAELSEELWDRLQGVNLKGVFLAVKTFLPLMTARGYGRIVATSSITGNRTAIAGMSHYAASKAGINGFVRAAALEAARSGVTVNAVEPGHVMTEGAAGLYDDEFRQAVEAHIPAGRFAVPEDVAACVAFLASREAAYVTGQTLTVDGGVTLREYPAGYPRQ